MHSIPSLAAIVGKVYAVTEIIAGAEQLFEFVPITLYVIEAVGLTVIELPLPLLLQTYVFAPLAVNVITFTSAQCVCSADTYGGCDIYCNGYNGTVGAGTA